MTFKTVLYVVGCDDEENAQEISAVMELAQQSDWHLTVLVLGIAPSPPMSTFGVTPQDLWVGELTAMQSRAESRAKEIRGNAQSRGLSADVAMRVCDHPQADDVVGERARFADVTLISGADSPGAVQVRTLYGALYKSARPVLMLPNLVPATFSPAVIMVAWDSGIPATRSVGHALSLMKAAELVRITIVDPIATPGADGPEPGADLALFLARHGVKVQVDPIPSGGRPVSQALVQHARDEDVDLIVMGAFGRSRLHQVVFGGTTTAVTKAPPVPLVLAH
jgi:nucleotide-binding universal stress UspA family protein